jgi:DNA-binding PadR family transcriptional regulator
MEGLVTTRAALLQALRSGPGYGLDLIRRVEGMTDGRSRLTEARVYPTLKALEGQGLVRAFQVTPRGRRGARMRTYYDLTIRGVQASTEERAVLKALLTRVPAWAVPGKRERALMSRRLLEADALSAFGTDLRAAMTRRPRA